MKNNALSLASDYYIWFGIMFKKDKTSYGHMINSLL